MPDPSALKMLVAATEAGDTETARATIRRDPTVLRDPRPLLKACRQADVAMVELLLTSGADPNRASRGDTPLHAAVYPSAHAVADDPRRGRIVGLLLAANADPTRRGSWLNIPPLHAAAFAGDRAAVDALLTQGVPTDGYSAAALGRVEAVRALLPGGLVAGTDPSGLAAVHFAAGSRLDDAGCAEVLSVLLAAGADPSQGARVGERTFEPVYFAVSAHSEARTTLLLDAGASATTALAVALWNGTEALSELAYARAGTADVRDSDGNSVLAELVRWGQLAKARWMLAHGADVNFASKDGRTALHAAASRGNTALVDELLGMGADPDAKDRDGHTPLDLARAGGRGPLNAATGAARRDA